MFVATNRKIMAQISFTLNGRSLESEVTEETKLLWFIRDVLKLTGTKFGCGIGQCGACTVHINGKPVRACLTPATSIDGQSLTTIEGLSPNGSHPLQKAWIDAQVPQCGYCQSGQIMQAVSLLEENPAPTRDEIVSHMNPILCRCGTYSRIVKAIQKAALDYQNH